MRNSFDPNKDVYGDNDREHELEKSCDEGEFFIDWNVMGTENKCIVTFIPLACGKGMINHISMAWFSEEGMNQYEPV